MIKINVLPLASKFFNLIDSHAKNEDIVHTDLFGHFDVCSV